MRHIAISIVGCILMWGAGHAQTWHLVSTKNTDIKTHATTHSPVQFNIDSANMEMHTAGMYYDHKVISTRKSGDQVLFHVTLNGKDIIALLDKKLKVLDYSIRLSDATPTRQVTRYTLDSLIEILPPVPDSVRRKDSIAKAKTKSAWSNDNLDTTYEKKIAEDTTVLETADKMPEFPGGKDAMMDYLKKKVHYLKEAAKEGKKGFVVVKAVIEKDGLVGRVYIKRSLGDACNQEAMRVVQAMPQWQPGSNNDEPKRIYVEIPVSFFPPDNKK